LVACFVAGNPAGPVYRGEIQTAGLGMAVEVWDAEAVELPPTQKGELVCTRAFPSVPVRFWNDPGDVRLRSAYFEDTVRPAWRHGDWIERTEHGGFVIHGRSDATLNPGGVRIGTAEIYRQVERLDEIIESVAVGQQWEGDERIVLFVVLRDGVDLDDDLRAHIRTEIKTNSSPRHIPQVVLSVPAIPRTISGKVSEIAVRRAIHGLSVDNVDALANPESLDHFQDLAELRG
jgi:acetoacetyl-CoA synthetase